ncbi:MAG: DUF3796 domain-containing protein [Bacteroidota bacterium]|nr:DUF3796 domain-containing protein [Bacteroidota bacterium]
MIKRKINPLGFFGFMGVIGIFGIFTNRKLIVWLAWFIWFVQFKKTVDERFYRNVFKSGAVCFFIATLGLAAVYLMRTLKVQTDIIFLVIESLFCVILIGFPVLFGIFERQGD